MALWALSDPHLAHRMDKPMDVFGPGWAQHVERMAAHWDAVVAPDDHVVLAGDISWAMRLPDVIPDLAWLEARPGRKILGKGNHDFWWPSAAKFRRLCEEQGFGSLELLYNNAIATPEAILVGSRGWIHANDSENRQEDEAIRAKELGRLRLSLEAARPLQAAKPQLPLLACLHFPPFEGRGQATAVTRLLGEFGVAHCIYGHVHGYAGRHSFNGRADGICYRNTAADALGFRPLRLDPLEALCD